jgi:uracil-DNA glycosylase family 4
MDAREKLRRYLEQRREMGESELVLDSMTVDEALRIVSGASSSRSSEAPAASARAETIDRSPRTDAPETADWRAALRATGAGPGSGPEISKRRNEFLEPSSVPIEPPRVREPVKPITPTSEEASTSARAPITPSPSTPSNEEPVLSDVPAGLSVGTPAGELLGGTMSSLDTLDALAKHVAACTKCTLYSTALNPVPGEGSPTAQLMCVGEAPGATEDETGRPFVGAAGQLLTKILAAINFQREDVFICNVLKHRPPGNRNPLPEEVKACSPYLIRQIELIRPRVILAFGTFAAQTLLDTKLSIGKLRSQIHRYYGVPLIVTYHPAALLRNPSWKRPTWEDVQLARRILDSSNTTT